MIDYSPMWTTMKERNISQYQLLKKGLDNKTLDSIKKTGILRFLHLKSFVLYLNVHPMILSDLFKSPGYDLQGFYSNSIYNLFFITIYQLQVILVPLFQLHGKG